MLEFFDLVVTTKQAWVYLLVGIVGVTFSVFYPVFLEDGKFHPKLLGRWFLLSLVFGFVVMLVDFSPLLSICIGLGSRKLISAYDDKLDATIELLKKVSPKDIFLRILSKDFAKFLDDIDNEKKEKTKTEQIITPDKQKEEK